MSKIKRSRKVGTVVDIDGKFLWFTKKFSTEINGVFQAAKGTQLNFGDVLQTDAYTTAVISFDVGGRAVIPPNKRISVTYEDIWNLTPFPLGDLASEIKSIDVLEDLIPSEISTQMRWTIDNFKRSSQPKKFQIETAGGVMGGLEG